MWQESQSQLSISAKFPIKKTKNDKYIRQLSNRGRYFSCFDLPTPHASANQHLFCKDPSHSVSLLSEISMCSIPSECLLLRFLPLPFRIGSRKGNEPFDYISSLTEDIGESKYVHLFKHFKMCFYLTRDNLFSVPLHLCGCCTLTARLYFILIIKT